MKITKITYQKAFVVGPYLQEKIGVEIEVEPGEEDDVFREAIEKVSKWHLEANPGLYTNPFPTLKTDKIAYSVPVEPATIDLAQLREKEQLEIAIDNATSLEDLAKLKEQAGKQGLIHPYMQKLNQLISK